MSAAPLPRILVVDDDEIDVMALERAFAEIGLAERLEVAGDGEAALGRLLEPDAAGRPVLLLLDLNMPRMGGFELLERRVADPALEAVTVFVMTTSARPQDIERAYGLGIAGYVVKSTRRGFSQAVAQLVERYLDLVTLPGAGDALVLPGG